MHRIVTYKHIPMLLEWDDCKGVSASQMPRTAGLYAQVYRPDRAVRIGQAHNIHTRLRQATAWANRMKMGREREAQLRRMSELCQRVKATGNDGFEYFLVSDHPDLEGKEFRMECEAYLFGWLETTAERNGWRNWNTERIQVQLRPIYMQARQEGLETQP